MLSICKSAFAFALSDEQAVLLRQLIGSFSLAGETGHFALHNYHEVTPASEMCNFKQTIQFWRLCFSLYSL